ncbi:MAG: cytochrome-c peroxidase, partial [Gammaproteobacteria bacterium]|nr:cytochrome-c peroxidase [Gammaproteobacteria bacterium]
MRSGFRVVTLAGWCLSAGAAPLGLPAVPIPADNPQNSAKIALGDKLFHDPRLSSSGQVSCATCHRDADAFTDTPLAVSRGVGGALGQRNAPSLANAAYFTLQFLDGRAASLEEQALRPLVDPVEMGLPDLEAAVATVSADADYRQRFRQAFGGAAAPTTSTLAQAIASYERTLVFGDSPFDRFQYQGEKDAMSPAAVRGLTVFKTWGRCVVCHRIEQSHATFTDDRFHNIGIGINRYPDDIERLAGGSAPAPPRARSGPATPEPARLQSELGRFAVTGKPADLGAFKTPSLRNVAVTPPYMHDGSLKTL